MEALTRTRESSVCQYSELAENIKTNIKLEYRDTVQLGNVFENA